MSTIQILSDICAERRRQDIKWGGPEHDDIHTADQWANFILDHNEQARDAGFYGPESDYRNQLVRVAALALAAIESHDRKQDV